MRTLNSEKRGTVKWINCAKCVAIMAVLIDHTYKILYTSQKIIYASYFSVSLFILISGITTYKSRAKNLALSGFKAYWHKVSDILIGYGIATALYIIAEYGYFDFEMYMNFLVHFNASGPLYFVLLYIQLMLVQRPLLYFLEKNRRYQVFTEVLLLVTLIVFAVCSVNYTNILNVLGGGGKLFGATYLVLFYGGMLLAKYIFIEQDMTIKNSLIYMIFGVGGTFWILWVYFLCKEQLILDEVIGSIFGAGVNPPGVTLMISALLMLFLCYTLFTFLEKSNVLGKKIVDLANGIGRQSLYIFLFHRLILDYFLVKYVQFENIWLMRGVYFLLMIVGSIMIGRAVGFFTHFIRKSNLPIVNYNQ